MSRPKHPLIDPQSPHYGKGDNATIRELEEALTVLEMIGFCLGNILKYRARMGKKEGGGEERKIKHYEAYLEELTGINIVYAQERVSDAWKQMGIEWEY